MRYRVTLDIEPDEDTTRHPSQWLWDDLIGEVTELVSVEELPRKPYERPTVGDITDHSADLDRREPWDKIRALRQPRTT